MKQSGLLTEPSAPVDLDPDPARHNWPKNFLLSRSEKLDVLSGVQASPGAIAIFFFFSKL